MIPNVGDISFYLQTMMSDYTADLLLAMSLMAGQLERKTTIVGPIIVSPFFSSGGEGSQYMESGTPSQVLVPTQGNGISTEKSVVDTPIQGQMLSSTMMSSLNASLVNSEKVKKRTPARIQKLLGDLYLLVGRLDHAIESYLNAIEGCKLNNDFQWQASALEGYLCTELVQLMKDYSSGDELQGQSLLSSRKIMKLALESKKLFSFVCELPERYREIVFLYDKSFTYGSFGYYPILQIQASLRIANFLSFAFLASFSGTFVNCAGIPWSNEAKSLTAELVTRMATSGTQTGINPNNNATNTLIPQQSASQTEKAILQNGIGVTRLDIMTWLTRISLTGNDYLTPKDYLLILTSVCVICSRIDAYRKHAFYLRLVGTVTRFLESKQFSSNAVDDEKASSSLKSWSLLSMHHVSDLLESPIAKSAGDDDIWLETYGPLLSNPHIQDKGPPPFYAYSLRYGWPTLRIGILKESIFLAENDQDHINTIVFTAKLLRKLFRQLLRKEQAYFSDLLLKVVLQYRKQIAAQPERAPLIKYEDGAVLGAPLLLRMDIVPSSARYSVTKHLLKKTPGEGVKETFLYSPFAKKKTEQKELIVRISVMFILTIL